jgi:copper chaperone CopZ
MNQLELSVNGMHCGGCVSRVSAALRAVTGVEVAEVAVGRARVSYDPARTSPQAITAALGKAGCTATSAAGPASTPSDAAKVACH